MIRLHSRSGQAAVEMALLLPVLVMLFLGAWTAADLIADNNAAAQASRAGARYAAEIGNEGYTSSSTASGCQTSASDPCQVDKDIIDQVLPIVTPKLTNAVVTEIDIYQPDSCSGGATTFSGTCPPDNGAYCCSELIDQWSISNGVGTAMTSPLPYNLSLRNETHPNESELGVRVIFAYTSPTLKFFTQTDSQYTVIRLAPEQ